tara:strand:- start:1137 stop:1661 length:525 start_codon:yes stop_codon:yes gene_type:complete
MANKYFSNNYGYDVLPQPITKRQHLFIDARDYLTASNTDLSFVVNLQDIGMPDYEEVEEVELKSIMFPKIAGEEYYILDIPEFTGRVHSTDNGSHDKFAVVYYDSSQTSAGDVKPMKGQDFDKKVHVFNPIKKRLSRFTVTFRKYGGDIITNTDIGSGDNYKKISMMFEFKIKT